ncbi:MAG: site-2 protease family protein, partial [Clostridia bacterium]|nr:site-2 protease family protein [Clostridia bacterium]
MFNIQSLLQQALYMIPVLLISLTVHEFSHGYVAYRLGDNTAKNAGRLTLNPLHHLDPIGTLMMLVAHIGWAKPVPINARNFKNPKQDTVKVGIAGPLSNIIMAFVFVIPTYIFNV